MNNEVRVRFAPSPTGYLHVGGARTALFNYLFARHHRGKFILRIEDTDRERFQQDALEEIYKSLGWLGLDIDEGPRAGGEFGPYIQSLRTDLYVEAAHKLLTSGNAYRCFCTPKRLQQIREEQKKNKKGTYGYDRHCRNLSVEEINTKLNSGIPWVVRLKIPDKKDILFNDLIRGEIKYRSRELDDIVLLKSDGYPTYHLANVVDDHAMRITHVMRGEEWIASTPKHILLYDALNYSKPEFAHLPVILANDGGKLSKRQGAASVMDYRDQGILPQALVNFLALLGWSPGDDTEIMKSEEIIQKFTLNRITAKASVFDLKKLSWMNGNYLRDSSIDSIYCELQKIIDKSGLLKDIQIEEKQLRKILLLLKDRSKTLNEIVTGLNYFFIDPVEYEEKSAKKRFKGDAAQILQDLTSLLNKLKDFTKESLEEVFRKYADQNELSGGKLIHPTRIAVSGVSFGPGLFEMLELIGREAVVRRMQTAINWIKDQPGLTGD
jgi:glutamyl-tRNA synthetase